MATLTWTKTADGYEATGPAGEKYAAERAVSGKFRLRYGVGPAGTWTTLGKVKALAEACVDAAPAAALLDSAPPLDPLPDDDAGDDDGPVPPGGAPDDKPVDDGPRPDGADPDDAVSDEVLAGMYGPTPDTHRPETVYDSDDGLPLGDVSDLCPVPTPSYPMPDAYEAGRRLYRDGFGSGTSAHLRRVLLTAPLRLRPVRTVRGR